MPRSVDPAREGNFNNRPIDPGLDPSTVIQAGVYFPAGGMLFLLLYGISEYFGRGSLEKGIVSGTILLISEDY